MRYNKQSKERIEMLAAISGGSGSGKSTIIDLLEKEGYDVIKIKTARTILKEWGMSLQEVYSNLDLTMKFQDELIERKLQDEQKASIEWDIIYTERTFADLFAFTVVNIGKYASASKWLDAYYKKCMEYQQSYRQVFYLRSGHFSIEDDNTRVTNAHYVDLLSNTMEFFTKQMTCSSSLHFIDTPYIEQRKIIIETFSRIVAK